MRNVDYYKYFKGLYSNGAQIEWTNTSNAMHENGKWYCIDDNKWSNYLLDEDFDYKTHQHIVYRIKGTEEIPSIPEIPTAQECTGCNAWNQNNTQNTKENTMNSTTALQQLLTQIFGAPKPETDYDKRPAYLVIAYSADGPAIRRRRLGVRPRIRGRLEPPRP